MTHEISKLNVILWKQRERDPPYHVYISYFHNGQRKRFSTGVKANPDEFSSTNHDAPISRKVVGYTTLNRQIRDKKQSIMEVVDELLLEKIDPTPAAVQQRLKKGKQRSINRTLKQ